MQESLIGLWSLVSWDKVYADGREEPFSEQALAGFLHYGPGGAMAVSIYERDQPKLITAYAGSYESFNQEVVHSPLEGYSPAGIQERKKRFVDLGQKTLFLSTDWLDLPAPQPVKYRLKWTRLT